MADLGQLHPVFRARLLALDADVGGLSWTSGWRSFKRQGELYDGWKARKPGYAPANRPGSSNHEAAPNGPPLGLAMDIGRQNRSAAHQRARAHGLHFPIRGEPWHIECIETTGRYQGIPSFPNQEDDDMTPDQDAMLRAASDDAKGAHETASRLEARLAVMEAATIDGSGVTVVERARQTLRLARVAAGGSIRDIYARYGVEVRTEGETAAERVARNVDEIETAKRSAANLESSIDHIAETTTAD